jgi:hypothetical protein
MSTKFLILFQNEIEIDKDPDWTLSFELGLAFDQQTSQDELLHTHYVLPLDQYQQILTVATLLSFETASAGKFLKYPTLNLKHLHLDTILDMIVQYRKVAR